MVEQMSKIFLRDMEVAYFVLMTVCVVAGMLIFLFRQIIKSIRSPEGTGKDRKKATKIAVLRILIGLIFIPFIVAYFPEISQPLLGVEEGILIAPVSALGSGMAIDRIIDQGLIKKKK